MTILFLIRGNWFQQILTKKTVYLSIHKFFGWLCLVFFFVFHLNFIDLKLQISCRHYKYALMMWKSAFNKLIDNYEKYFKILGIWTCWWNFMKIILAIFKIILTFHFCSVKIFLQLVMWSAVSTGYFGNIKARKFSV